MSLQGEAEDIESLSHELWEGKGSLLISFKLTEDRVWVQLDTGPAGQMPQTLPRNIPGPLTQSSCRPRRSNRNSGFCGHFSASPPKPSPSATQRSAAQRAPQSASSTSSHQGQAGSSKRVYTDCPNVSPPILSLIHSKWILFPLGHLNGSCEVH